MSDIAIHAREIGKRLNRRRAVTVELHEFVIRAVIACADEANENATADEEVTFDHVVEWLLIAELTTRRTVALEAAIPGFTAALATWLMNATYQPPDDET